MGMLFSRIGAFKPLSLLILNYRGRRVAVYRHPCRYYEGVLWTAQCTFQDLHSVPSEKLVILASIPGYPDQGEVEISPNVWSTIGANVHSVTVALESEMRFWDEYREATLRDYLGVPAECDAGLSPLASSSSTLPTSPLVPPPTQPSSMQRGKRNRRGQSNNTTQTAASKPQDEILVRKPVIYLYPPSSLADVTVELQLAPSWSFSAVYPPPQATIPSGEHPTAQSQALTWAVAAEPSGTLVDKASDTEVSYLYWEAIANTQPITPNSSRATTPVGDIEAFDPSRPSVTPGDSVLLPIGKVPAYLDEVLKALALHTEARTSFITYWLPDLLKHEYIALRFLPQASYEQAAQMRVSPAPDVVTRVFMLFCGVAPGDLCLWEQAAARAIVEDGHPTFWARIVGVDSARASDHSLFRVLEWGGMEVK